MRLIWTSALLGLLWAQTDTLVVHSGNIVCQTCRRTIIRGLSTQKGVRFVEVDVPKQNILIVYRPDKTDPTRLRHAITRLGYDADTLPRDMKAYQKLPDCCRADRPH